MQGLPGDPSSNDSWKDPLIDALTFHKTMSSFVLFWGSTASAELHCLPDVCRWMNSCILLGKNMQQPLLSVLFPTSKAGFVDKSYRQETCQLCWTTSYNL